MQLILETESLDINTKMSEIDVQSHLNTKSLSNGIVDSIKIVNGELNNKEEIIQKPEPVAEIPENDKCNKVKDDTSSCEKQINVTETKELVNLEKTKDDQIDVKSNESGIDKNANGDLKNGEEMIEKPENVAEFVDKIDDKSGNEEQINTNVTEDLVNSDKIKDDIAELNKNSDDSNDKDEENSNGKETLTEKTGIDTITESSNIEETTKKIVTECNIENKENGHDNGNDTSENVGVENNTEENIKNTPEIHENILEKSLNDNEQPKNMLNNIEINAPDHYETDNETCASTRSVTETVQSMDVELTNSVESKPDKDNIKQKEEISTLNTRNDEEKIVDDSITPINSQLDKESEETTMCSPDAATEETDGSSDGKFVETMVSNTENNTVTENITIEETTVDDSNYAKDSISEKETVTAKSTGTSEIVESMDVDEEPEITNSKETVDPKHVDTNDGVTDAVSVEKDSQEKTDNPANGKIDEHDCVESPEQIDSSDDCMEVSEVSKETPDGPKKLTSKSVLASEVTEANISSEKTDSTVIVKATERKKSVSGLSNSLNILSDDEEEEPVMSENKKEQNVLNNESEDKCINIEDDDDIMLIDDDTNCKQEISKTESPTVEEIKDEPVKDEEMKVEEGGVETIESVKPDVIEKSDSTANIETPKTEESDSDVKVEDAVKDDKPAKVSEKKPIVPPNFLKTFKTNVAEMTREELEEFCLVKIVEGVIDRSNLSEIKAKLKTMSQSMEEWRKKSMMLTKQNRDLQIVLKTVTEEQKKRTDLPITPLKITRSVGMQVFMSDLSNDRAPKRKGQLNANNRPGRPPVNPSPRPAKAPPNTPPANAKPQQIPVPRLVPATNNNSPSKNTKPTSSQVQSSTVSSNSEKTSTPTHNGVKNTTPVKPVEKRPFSSVQSVTVDLTDDEPPHKQVVTSRNAPQPPVRLVAQQQLLTPRGQMQNQTNQSGPRKVYIPINQNTGHIRPGQTIMLKSVPTPPRPRHHAPILRLPNSSGTIRLPRNQTHRHPAPLPDVAKQSQPPNWKSLPPAPDLKISKVENGIVISWKIEGYQEDSYEEIASYQLYAYQETSSPPSTMLWKKIGDVKALPLPMACTLTQFMAGYKYFFAVRAVDVRSRIGPFSLPGSILLLNK
ncbi:unnamed protein product [Plutella xylostella]|uniref:(diamondback moth) hypothetical protein n=1 Tax=Plutella xylostella TaxID=51655 RepID=A0A8S4CWE1_PLUXY|nr:unnamed protein product [Plutella xylostella]